MTPEEPKKIYMTKKKLKEIFDSWYIPVKVRRREYQKNAI